MSGYRAGCRCDACKNSQRINGQARHKAALAKGLATDDRRHGTTTGYNLGCRCVLCKQAESTQPKTEKHIICCRLRSRLRQALRLQSAKKKLDKTLSLTGLMLPDLKNYIESKFTEGMSWGVFRKNIHIDHIRPCASFDLTDPEQQKQCFHFTNLQQLWAADNLRKGDSWTPPAPTAPAQLSAPADSAESSPPSPSL